MATAVASNTSKLGKGPHKELRHNHAFSLLATKQKVSIVKFTSPICNHELSQGYVQSRLHVSNVNKMYAWLQVEGPPRAGAFAARCTAPTNFRKFYERGDFPIALEHDTKGNKIAWKVSAACAKTTILNESWSKILVP
jgi:hypothetical protein